MAPKNKNKGNAKNKADADEDVTLPRVKAASSINVRHILVRLNEAHRHHDHER
jgi:hypothetical protein